jgi:hypothetical protein
MEQYPQINSLSKDDEKEALLIIKSLTYNVEFLFLPYNIKITENLTPDWNEQPVFGRMDPVSNFKRMGRTMTIAFQARQKSAGAGSFINLDGNELLHIVDHLKKTLYPRYNSSQIMLSPPLFRVRYGNLIMAGENTIGRGVLCYITSFSANPVMDINKVQVYESSGLTPFYPKIFDINLTFTVLNEQLAQSQDNNILTDRYFYNFATHYHEQNKKEDFERDSNLDNKLTDEEKKAESEKVLMSEGQ